ncbi:MAG: ATP-binding protein [Candidatus Omnitrophica bacterium]|nr:ATP-binding protein [Candidatus Omnitrophota bacterium]MBI3020701.1 ATP-binding protein [Candidatus Omnitrophota bacterium]
MKYIPRLLEEKIRRAVARNKSVLLFGARQTGKTTLIHRFEAALSISLIRPEVRQRYEKSPEQLAGEVEALARRRGGARPLVVVDEVQKVPALLDVVQDLIDRRQANFVLTGSSARKLRRGAAVNLLPGRVATFRLDPFSLREVPATSVEERLLYGSLPGLLAVPNLSDRETDLESYVTTYLEDEVRAEALVRRVGDFARFLELAASESGNLVNTRKLSQEIGVSHTTIAGYYQILEDCLIAERIEPLSHSATRKKLTKSEKYLFFDLGVRRLAAREGTRPSRENFGRLFEQFVGLELVRCAHVQHPVMKIRFWRDPDGPEVDWVIDDDGAYIPVEVKWTDRPQPGDLRALELFLREYASSKQGYLVCRVPRNTQLSPRITAVPWQSTDELIPG